MKTNMKMLRKKVRKEEERLELLKYQIQELTYNELNEELDGKTTTMIDNTEKFNEKIEEIEKIFNSLLKHKKILLEKENNLKLDNEMTLKEIIITIKYSEKLKYFYESLLRKNNKKIRMNDSKSIYFLEYKTNINIKEIKNKIKEIDKKIDILEKELDKLNKIEFEIE